MRYTTTDGRTATGVVWSPGPFSGTAWLLPYSGAPAHMAFVVHVRTRQRLSEDDLVRRFREARGTYKDRNGRRHDCPDDPLIRRAALRQAFNDGPQLTKRDWHAALGFDPAEQVRAAEAAGEQVALDLTA